MEPSAVEVDTRLAALSTAFGGTVLETVPPVVPGDGGEEDDAWLDEVLELRCCCL